MTEFESCWLYKYLVETLLVSLDSYQCKELAMSIRVYYEWNNMENLGSNYYL